jgi:hypothetical protein
MRRKRTAGESNPSVAMQDNALRPVRWEAGWRAVWQREWQRLGESGRTPGGYRPEPKCCLSPASVLLRAVE